MDSQSDSKLSPVDTIVHLASLASKREDIDPILEPMRFITARLTGDQELTGEDQQTLQKIRAELETYLIAKEPVRKLTKEILEQKLYEQNQGRVVVRRLGWILWTVWLIATAFGLLTAILLSGKIDEQLLGESVVSVFLTVIHAGAAWIFVSAFKSFKPELRRTYRLIVAGTIILGLFYLQKIALSLPGLHETIWATNGAQMLPFLLAFAAMYGGLRELARTLALRSKLLSVPFIVTLNALAVAVVLGLPHHQAFTSELEFRVSVAITAVVLVMCILSGLVGLLIRRHIGLLYVPAITWLIGAYLTPAVTIIAQLLYYFFAGGIENISVAAGAVAFGLPIAATGFLLLKSASVFKRVSWQ